MLTGEGISEDYGHDELGGVFSMPEVLVKIMNTEEAAGIMSYASEKKIPVVVRGAGTGLVGGAVAVHGGIMLDTTAMNRILELDRENLTVGISVPMPEGCGRSSMGSPGIMSGGLRWWFPPAMW